VVITHRRKFTQRQTKWFHGLVGLNRTAARSRWTQIRRISLELLEDRTVLSTLYVDPSGRTPGGLVAYTTIQAAVNAASAGDLIRVDPGSYTENVTIPANASSLTLDGAQSGVNPVPGRPGPESVIHGSLTANASGVTIDGFTVSSAANWCIQVNGGSVVENCILDGLTPEYTYAVWVAGNSNTVSDNSMQAGAVYLNHAPFSLVFGNKIVGPPSWSATEGIDFYYSPISSAWNNEIDNCTYVFGIRSSEDLSITDNFGSGDTQLFEYNLPDSTDTVLDNNFSLSPVTVTTVTSSANASVYGQTVTFTATVTSGGLPVSPMVDTGTVTFQEGNTILSNPMPLDNNGHASFRIATLTAADSPHTITAYFSGSPGLHPSSGSVRQTVDKVPLLVTAENRTKIYGQANPAFAVDYTGFVLGENTSVLSGTLSFSTTATAASPVGSYAIAPSGLASGNYTLFFASGILTITPATLIVTPSDASREFGMPNPSFTGAITGIQNGDNLTASYSTPATRTSPVGTYPITATLNDPGHKLSNYTVTLNQGTLTITPAPPFYTVTNTADSGPGSLRNLLLTAPAGSIVQFQAGLSGTITLTSGTLSIAKHLTIAGPGAGLITVSGSNRFEVFSITIAVTVTISGLTIGNGTSTSYGGGIANNGTLTLSNSAVSSSSASSRGGGIYNSVSGMLLVSNSVVTGNSANNAGGGIFNVGTMIVSASTLTANGGANSDGGAIYNQGTLTITSSTLAGNGGVNAYGGAVRCDGTLTVDGSAFSANIADSGGAIYNVGTLTVANSTFAGNSATNRSGHGGGAIDNAGTGARATVINCTVSGNTTQNQGGGLASGMGSLILGNTIVAGNTASAGPDIAGTVTSRGHNLIGNGSGSTGLVNGVRGDQVGTSASPLDSLLGALQDNGGPTATFALLPGSPAINAGDRSVAVDARGNPLATDQRGFSRLSNGTVDIGAFEMQTFVVSTLNDGGTGSLRSALASADLAGGSTIIFVVNGTLALATALPDITRSVQVLGPGAGLLTVQRSLAPGMPAFRIFTVDGPRGAIQDVTVILAGLTVSNGQISDYGGGISNSAKLTLLGSTIAGNFANPRGGGIYNSPSGTLTLDSSLVSGNATTQAGGGIFNDGIMTVNHSTFSGNGGPDPNGGAILNLGTLTVFQSTFSGNGGVNALGGAIRNDGTLTVDGSTFSKNTAKSGGAIYNAATLTVVDSSTFSANTAGTGGAIYNAGMLMLSDSQYFLGFSYIGNASPCRARTCTKQRSLTHLLQSCA
jgi:predicted outer membrane repeat protein